MPTPFIPTSIKKRLGTPHGFTLLELLVVIAIIGVIAAILIPVVGTVRTKASSAQCTSQMRQIGYAFQQYLVEHNNILPTSYLGHPFSGQGPYYNRDPRRIQAHIGPYLNVPEATTWSTAEENMTYSGLFSWTAWEENRRGPGPSMIGNLPVKLIGEDEPANQPPWGQSYLKIDNPVNAPLYTEADAVLVPTAGWSKYLPPEPVHGDVRNTIFFDSHVEQVNIDVDLRNL